MTDNEIIKALECWINDFAGKATQFVSLCNALDLINRQKETIEQLKTALFKCGEEMAEMQETINRQKAEIERYEKTVGKLAINKDGIVIGTLDGKETEYIQKSVAEVFRNMAVNRAKTEAVKEFAERLKAHAYLHKPYGMSKVVDAHDIDNLVKEFTGGADGNQSL
jgi:cob(I)alamin adenosyltransferase